MNDKGDIDLSIDQKIKLIEMLLAHAHREAGLFWVRNSVFTLVNIGAIGWTYRDLSLASTATEIETPFYLSLSGLVLTVIWLLMNRTGRRANHVFIRDAAKLAEDSLVLRQVFKESFGMRTPSGAGTPNGGLFAKIRELSTAPTGLNYYVIFLFLVGWGTLNIASFDYMKWLRLLLGAG